MDTLYARHEPTTDATTRQYVPQGQLEATQWQDVVLYYDKACTRMAARIPGHYTKSKPTRRNKYQMLNCYRYKLVWVD